MAFRHKTLAIVARAPNLPPSLEKICLDGLRPDEAIVEIHAVGVCHLEIAILHGHIPQPFPRVLGHEGVYENLSGNNEIIQEKKHNDSANYCPRAQVLGL
jgi:hypothetical protein